MSKFLSMALMLFVGIGLLSAPAMAQDANADDVGTISRGGGEGTDSKLGSKGLEFKTDGFSLRLTTRVQVRLTYQNETANGSDGQNGRDFVNFRIRRAKSTFSGHIFEKEFQYGMTLSWTGGNIIEEAFFRWTAHQYANITVGQRKLQWSWEEKISSGSQQFVDRGYVNEVFNQDFAKGITIDGKIGDDVPWLKYWVGVYNGVLKGSADFRNADQAIRGDTFSDSLVDAEMMVNMRLETHPLGEVKGMNDQRGEDDRDQILFAVGMGLNWFLSGFNNSNLRPDTATGGTGSGRFRTNQDTVAMTLDAHFRWMGLSVDAAFYYRKTEFHNRGSNSYRPQGRQGIGDLTDMAFTFDVSYFIIAKKFNVGMRYNMLNADDFWMNGSSSRSFAVWPDTTEIGLSANYYIHGENLKLTFDVLYVSQQLALNANADGAGGTQALLGVYNSPPGRRLSSGGVAESSADYNDLWIVRLQLQWIF